MAVGEKLFQKCHRKFESSLVVFKCRCRGPWREREQVHVFVLVGSNQSNYANSLLSYSWGDWTRWGGPNKRHTNSNNNTFYSNREQWPYVIIQHAWTTYVNYRKSRFYGAERECVDSKRPIYSPRDCQYLSLLITIDNKLAPWLSFFDTILRGFEQWTESKVLESFAR